MPDITQSFTRQPTLARWGGRDYSASHGCHHCNELNRGADSPPIISKGVTPSCIHSGNWSSREWNILTPHRPGFEPEPKRPVHTNQDKRIPEPQVPWNFTYPLSALQKDKWHSKYPFVLLFTYPVILHLLLQFCYACSNFIVSYWRFITFTGIHVTNSLGSTIHFTVREQQSKKYY